MSLLTLLRRRRAPGATAAPAAPAPPVFDRSALLAELEVSVPAPERLVRWETATRACPDCAGEVGRSADQCRRCGHAVA